VWFPAVDTAGLRSQELSSITLRPAVADDAQAISAVFDAAVRDEWAFLGELAQRPMFAPRYWDQLVADHAPPNALLVASDATNAIVGFTAVHSDEGEMFLLFVDPAHAGRGIGRALLGAAHDVLRAAGRTEAFLFVEERNARALAVYAAAGYPTTARSASRTSTARPCASCGSPRRSKRRRHGRGSTSAAGC
jgi:ribosomal protein S18 acetylase RimI-like enzyme